MKLDQYREPSTKGATLSTLVCTQPNETPTFVCDILEDVVREVPGQPVDAWKVHGETAISAGTYEVTFENSARFGPNTLTVNAVPGFVGIRIHGGNTSANTEGCLLPGLRNSEYTVARSQDNLQALRSLCREAVDRGEKITLTIHPAK